MFYFYVEHNLKKEKDCYIGLVSELNLNKIAYKIYCSTFDEFKKKYFSIFFEMLSNNFNTDIRNIFLANNQRFNEMFLNIVFQSLELEHENENH